MRNRSSTLRSFALALPASVALAASMVGIAHAQSASPSTPAEAAPGPTRQAILDRGELRVAGPVYLPFMIQKPDGSYDGIDVRAVGVLAQKLGVNLNIIPAGWDTVVAGLTTDKWDIVPSLCVTAARDEVIDYSNPYVDLKLTFYVKADNPKNLTTLADLDRPDVLHVVATGSAGAETIHQRFPNAQVKELPGVSDPEMLQEVLSGRADVAGSDWPVTYNVLNAKYGDQIRFIPNDPAEMIPAGCPVAWGLPQGDAEWQSYVNAFLQDFIASGEFQKLNDEFFSPESLKSLFP